MKWKEKTTFQKGVTVASVVFTIAGVIFLVLACVDRYTAANIAGGRRVYGIPLGLAFVCRAILDWKTRKSDAKSAAFAGGVFLITGISYLFL